MADIKYKEKMWSELETLSKGIQFPAELEGDEETLALAKVLQYALTAVKDPAKREQLVKCVKILEEIPSSQDIYDALKDVI